MTNTRLVREGADIACWKAHAYRISKRYRNPIEWHSCTLHADIAYRFFSFLPTLWYFSPRPWISRDPSENTLDMAGTLPVPDTCHKIREFSRLWKISGSPCRYSRNLGDSWELYRIIKNRMRDEIAKAELYMFAVPFHSLRIFSAALDLEIWTEPRWFPVPESISEISRKFSRKPVFSKFFPGILRIVKL